MIFSAVGLVDSGDRITCERTEFSTYRFCLSIGRLAAEMNAEDLQRVRAAIDECLDKDRAKATPALVEGAPA